MGNSLIVGFMDTSALADRRLGSVAFRQTNPRGELWALTFGADGYFWGYLPSGTFRLEQVSVYNSADRSSITKLDLPANEKDLDLSGEGSAFFFAAFKLEATLEKTRTTMGGSAIFILATAITIRRVGNPTEKEVLSSLLKKLGDRDRGAQNSIRKRLAEIDGVMKVEASHLPL